MMLWDELSNTKNEHDGAATADPRTRTDHRVEDRHTYRWRNERPWRFPQEFLNIHSFQPVDLNTVRQWISSRLSHTFDRLMCSRQWTRKWKRCCWVSGGSAVSDDLFDRDRTDGDQTLDFCDSPRGIERQGHFHWKCLRACLLITDTITTTRPSRTKFQRVFSLALHKATRFH